MKKILFTILAVFVMFTSANAYDFNKYSINGGADLMANYDFRGVNLGGLSLQPWAEFSSYGLTFGAWGSIGSLPYDTDDGYHGFGSGNYELDLYLSYTTPLDIFTLKVTHLYYFDGSPFFDYTNDGSSSTQTELEGYFSWNGLSVGAATQVGGGDCYSLFTGDSILDVNGNPYKMWSTYIYVTYDWEINDNMSWKNEVGFSPHKSCYTYYDSETGKHAKFAVNNITSTFTYSYFSNDFLNLYTFAGIRFNLFDVGYDKFEYGKNFGWNVGIGIEL